MGNPFKGTYVTQEGHERRIKVKPFGLRQKEEDTDRERRKNNSGTTKVFFVSCFHSTEKGERERERRKKQRRTVSYHPPYPTKPKQPLSSLFSKLTCLNVI